MLTAFPPGGAPPAINRQLPQSLAVPGLQQQAAGQMNPFGQPQGLPSDQSGLYGGQSPLNTQPPGMNTQFGQQNSGVGNDPGQLTGIISALMGNRGANQTY